MHSNPIPFLLSPAGKDYLWGGDRLKSDFHKQLNISPLAETWECSTHPDGVSLIDSGIYRGKPLDIVLREHPEYLGRHPLAIIREANDGVETAIELPVLIKLIDARQKLSVQVHPDDEYAKAHENGALGKTEMWYILDAEPGAQLIYGFNTDMNQEKLAHSLSRGTIEKYLQKISVKKDDIFFTNPGTVHAIGAGILLAEVQENSNLTYRLYDYDRVDKQGQKRPLHLKKAMEVLNYKSSENPRQPMRTLRYRPGYASELLGRCKYFQVERILINTAEPVQSDRDYAQLPDCTTDEVSFRVLLCVEGQGRLNTREETLPFVKGSCIFLPAGSAPCKLQGKAQLLQVSC